ncbi:hypothetical protein GNF10_32070 [Nostoc sp. UCD121]|uniref:hypothetical protein n=1 Tax=unclassified Nostoc TaxID=2593658 RepID=UPI0015C39EF9|nr:MULTISPECIES: hypothetical protein [unclassified Nostoc]MBC1221630.1 hypothetical protein [Nostoc sp. UCD120]MBC1280454.1 hypothetical protein [Nostoc sp. UCD121]QLE53836.1 hypothetical protein FD724_39025 [Nostoc sp. C057]
MLKFTKAIIIASFLALFCDDFAKAQYLTIPENLPKNITNNVPQDVANIADYVHYLKFGRLAVRYPSSWNGGLRPQDDRYQISNVDRFTGGLNEVYVGIFAPVKILEQAGVVGYTPERALETYLRFLSGRYKINVTQSQIQQVTLYGKTLWLWRQPNNVEDGKKYDALWIGYINEYGVLNVITATTAPGELKKFQQSVLAIALSTTYIPPQRNLDSPEADLRDFHQKVGSGNVDNIEQNFCQSDRLMIAASDVLFGRQMRELLETYIKIGSAFTNVDMSDVYYDTRFYDPQKGRAIVKVSGNVTYSDNGNTRVVSIPNYLKKEAFRLIKENGKWKLCDTAR